VLSGGSLCELPLALRDTPGGSGRLRVGAGAHTAAVSLLRQHGPDAAPRRGTDRLQRLLSVDRGTRILADRVSRLADCGTSRAEGAAGRVSEPEGDVPARTGLAARDRNPRRQVTEGGAGVYRIHRRYSPAP